ncbi:MAG: hypothetical protein ACOYO0_14240 [Sandarakinorhabdus sp.]
MRISQFMFHARSCFLGNTGLACHRCWLSPDCNGLSKRWIFMKLWHLNFGGRIMRTKLFQLSGVAAAALMSIAAQAQQAPTSVAAAPAAAAEAEAIVVTGSRIRRDPLSQSAPVQILDSQFLAQTGLSSVADILQRIPAASGGLLTSGRC